MYNRRSLLKSSVCAVALSGLASCAWLTNIVNTGLADVKVYANDLVNALGSALSDVKNLLPADIFTKLTGYFTEVATYNTALQGVTTTVSGQGVISIIANLVNKIVAGLSSTGFTLPFPVPEILTAAKVILPVIEGLLGIQVSGVIAPEVMTTDQAKAILHNAAANYVASGSKI